MFIIVFYNKKKDNINQTYIKNLIQIITAMDSQDDDLYLVFIQRLFEKT